MVRSVGWTLRTLPATLHAVTPPGGIVSSEPVNSRIVVYSEVTFGPDSSGPPKHLDSAPA
jgi:hypothetical protein